MKKFFMISAVIMILAAVMGFIAAACGPLRITPPGENAMIGISEEEAQRLMEIQEADNR